MAVGVGKQAASSFVEEVEEKGQLFSVVGLGGIEVFDYHAFFEVRL